MIRTEYQMWLNQQVSKELMDYLNASKENITRQIVNGSCQDTFTYGKTVGMLEVLEYILNAEWLEPETEEEKK